MVDARILLGDARTVLKGLGAESFDSMVTDPPAGISFMGSEWDTMVGFEDLLVEVFTEAYRVLRPGAHILVWSIPRTSHKTALAIERSGYEIRDGLWDLRDRSGSVRAFLESLTEEQVELFLRALPSDSFMLHIFGQGMPKGQDIGKALEEREISGTSWKGWHTGLRPAVEIWWLARKPLREKRLIDQVLATGTGAINIDASRIPGDMSELINPNTGKPRSGVGTHYSDSKGFGGFHANPPNPDGRWPTNLVLEHGPGCKRVGAKKVPAISGGAFSKGKDPKTFNWRPSKERHVRHYGGEDGTETVDDWDCAPGCPIQDLDTQSGNRPGMSGGGKHREGYAGKTFGGIDSTAARNDFGGASRFFNTFEFDPEYVPFVYTGKVTPGERKEDLEEEGLINDHPTVKTRKLMSHLVRLVTPPNGRVLDPFAGSGSTIVAAVREGFSGLGIEQKESFHQIASKRVLRALEREQSASAAREDFDFMLSLESE